MMLWGGDGTLQVAIREPKSGLAIKDLTPVGSVASARLCKELFNLYLGQKPLFPEARATFLAGARALAAK